MTKYNYVPISADQIPDGVRFDCPRHLQGQIIVVEYGCFDATEACHGDPYKRITDTSVFPHDVAYYKRA